MTDDCEDTSMTVCPDLSALSKSSRRVLTLETKMEILQRVERGESSSSLGRAYGVNESSVRSIRRNAAALKRSVSNSSETSVRVCNRARDPLVERTEHALSAWIEANKDSSPPLNSVLIRNEALKIYEGLAGGKSDKFQASKGWFEKFKKRQTSAAESEPNEPPVDATELSAQTEEVLRGGEYSPQQVFYANQVELFWKRLPSRTFITTEERRAPGFKSSKDKLVVFLCANATGDFKCEPLLLYHSLMPRALKNVHSFPVHWRASKKGRITCEVVADWLKSCFAKEVEQYCTMNALPFKVLLIFDATPHNTADLDGLHPNVRVLFASVDVSPAHAFAGNFKLCYVLKLMTQMHDEVREPNKDAIRAFWKKYNVRQSMDVIVNAWESIDSSVVNDAWKSLWRECTADSKEIAIVESDYVDEIVKLARECKLKGFDESGLRELVVNKEDVHDEELEHLLQTDVKPIVEHDEAIENPFQIRQECLLNFLKQMSALTRYAIDVDPNVERSVELKRKIYDAAAEYQQMYNRGKIRRKLL